MGLAQNLVNSLLKRFLVDPVCVALQAALSRDLDDIDFIQQAEALQERTVGQVSGKVAITLLEVGAHDIRAQSPAAVSLISCQRGGWNLLLGRWGLSYPLLGRSSDELLFCPGDEDLIDAQEFVAEFAIIDIALDGGQRGSERLLEGNKGGGHAARLYSSFDKSSEKA